MPVRSDELQAHFRALELASEALGREPEEARASIGRIAQHIHQLADRLGRSEIAEAAAALTVQAPSVELVRSVLENLRKALEPRAVPEVILVVDDDRVSARLLQKRLATTNHRVVLAESVAEAEKALEAQPLACVILDLFLPDGDGRNFLLELRNRGATRDVPVVVVSGNTSPLAKSESIALGANAYVEKPFDLEELVRVVTAQILRSAERSYAPTGGPLEAGSVSAPGRVLLAEDDLVTARLIIHRLERDGFEVVHRDDGLAALEEARRGGFDLIILDVKMPGMDGFEVLGRLREVEGDLSTPVLILTGMGNEEDVVKAFEMGASDYVLKPFSPVELTARVRRLLAAR